jgi:21S rRNA (uridine2791-2'-O)-methyltransferase
VQADIRAYVQDPERGRVRESLFTSENGPDSAIEKGFTEAEVDELEKSYVDLERSILDDKPALAEEPPLEKKELALTTRQRDSAAGRVVDVVLSDMSEPWDQTTGFRQKSISNSYHRMMNTSGNTFKDHAGSMV